MDHRLQGLTVILRKPDCETCGDARRKGAIDMIKKTVVSAVCAVALLVGIAAVAQENATLTLKSGEQITGQLVDLGGVGFTVRVNGQDRQIPQNDVAVIDFTGGSIDWNNYNGNQQV